uniref:G_PROTEIN_RECEP_F1_2 domain-containing protein n=1 Tax=Syphacia muris TaxID=451379 RepID=A0A0N5B0T8_9BILA
MRNADTVYIQNQSVLLKAAKYACGHFDSVTPFLDLHCYEFPNKHTLSTQIIALTAFSLIIIVGILGNGVVMWIIAAHKVMRKSFNYFIFNMAFADCMTVILNVGTTLTFNFYYDWWFGQFCTVNLFITVALTCVSVFTMITVSWDRCYAVVFPLNTKALLNKHYRLLICLIWFLASLAALPNATYATVQKHYFYSSNTDSLNKKWICKSDFKSKDLYEAFILLIQYIIPLIILTLTYGSIAWVIQHENYENGQTEIQTLRFKSKKKVIKMLALVVAVFMICWLPYQLCRAVFDELLQRSSEFKLVYYTYLISYWLAMSAAAYNPFIYCLSSNRFRIGFKYAFRWLPFVKCTDEEYAFSELFPERLSQTFNISSHVSTTPKRTTLRSPSLKTQL